MKGERERESGYLFFGGQEHAPNTIFHNFNCSGDGSGGKKRGRHVHADGLLLDPTSGVVVSHSVFLNNACKRPRIQARGERSAAITERKRRMQMGDSLLKLKSLLPNTLKMDKCGILREAENYIASLQAKIENLNQTKQNLVEQLAPQERNFVKYGKGKINKVEDEEYEEEGENQIDNHNSALQGQIWVEQIHDSKDVFITCSSSFPPSFTSPSSSSFVSSLSSSSFSSSSSSSSCGSSLKMHGKRRVIMSRVLCILDNSNIEVMNANGSWKEDGSSHFMLHGKIQGGSELSPMLLKEQLSSAFVYEYM